MSSCIHSTHTGELTHLHGLKEETVVQKMGTPESEGYLKLSKGEYLPEDFIEIHNTYHPNDPQTEGVKIKVLRWISKGKTKNIFLHQVEGEWIVLESSWHRQ